jgi:hypothetical protein
LFFRNAFFAALFSCKATSSISSCSIDNINVTGNLHSL